MADLAGPHVPHTARFEPRTLSWFATGGSFGADTRLMQCLRGALRARRGSGNVQLIRFRLEELLSVVDSRPCKNPVICGWPCKNPVIVLKGDLGSGASEGGV